MGAHVLWVTARDGGATRRNAECGLSCPPAPLHTILAHKVLLDFVRGMRCRIRRGATWLECVHVCPSPLPVPLITFAYQTCERRSNIAVSGVSTHLVETNTFCTPARVRCLNFKCVYVCTRCLRYPKV